MWARMKLMMSGVWTFLEPFAKQLMTQAGSILAQTAIEAVTSVEASMQSSDGATKRAQAFYQITQSLETQGVKLAVSLVNAAIEAAVVKMQAK